MSTSTLQGLPPLPKSLQTLLCAGVAQWREMEKTHQLRTLIQQQLAAENGTNGISVGPRSNGEQTQDSDDASPVEMPVRPAVSSSCYPSGSASRGIEAAISHLHQEMVSLRQLDMSLLCQLMSLNESIQEYKHLLHDRAAMSDTMSDCSSIIEEEHDYENTPYHNDKYVNEFFHRPNIMSTTPPPEESIYEPVTLYAETSPMSSSPIQPPRMQKRSKTKTADNGVDILGDIPAIPATYESNC